MDSLRHIQAELVGVDIPVDTTYATVLLSVQLCE